MVGNRFAGVGQEKGSGRRFVMFHGTSRRNWHHILQKGFIPSQDGALGAEVYVTRKEKKAANYMPDDGVIIKMRVRLGRHLVITRQGHPLQHTWMDCGCGSVFAPVGVLWEDEREENCIANPSRIEILGLAHGYKAPCRYGLSCTRKSGCKFDHSDEGDVQCATTRRGRKRKNRRSPSAMT
jgi:hypothetical protein